MNMRLKLIICCLVILGSCTFNNKSHSDKDKLMSKFIYDDKGNIQQEYRMNIDSITLYVLEYDIEGNVIKMVNYRNNMPSGELLTFHDNGKISVKASMDSIHDKFEGFSYYFYESGVISGERFFRNNKKIGRANDYYDISGNLKSFLLYNNNGELYYRKTIDEDGSVISVEGEK